MGFDFVYKKLSKSCYQNISFFVFFQCFISWIDLESNCWDNWPKIERLIDFPQPSCWYYLVWFRPLSPTSMWENRNSCSHIKRNLWRFRSCQSHSIFFQNEAQNLDDSLSSLSQTSFNYINSIVGSGVIGIPYALVRAGYGVGLILLIFVAIITDYSLRLMVNKSSLIKTFLNL